MNSEPVQPYDLIGDIHGELGALERLLETLGYAGGPGGMSHPDGRKLLFLGDYIDRGPDSRGVLRLVRRLVDSGVALAIMGNHEFNFIAYQTQNESGRYLRSHSHEHAVQVGATLRSFAGSDNEISEWIEWMKCLPFFLDLGDLRAVHASWVSSDIELLAGQSLADRDFLLAANRRQSPAWEAIGRVLKGVEVEMPDGITVKDANSIPRKTMRIRWWGDIANLTWREIAFPLSAELPEGRPVLGGLEALLSYGAEEPPVFCGHYKLIGHPAKPQSDNVASLDFGLGHGGPATAYRWSGERVLDEENFVQVS